MKIKFLIPFLLVLVLCLGMGYTWTSNQTKLHDIAELARELNLPEDNPIIQEASRLWFFDNEDIRILANVVYHESKYCTDRHQQLVAQVVLNRIASDEFPDTMYDVITQRKQYSSAYVRNLPSYFNCDDEMRRCFENVMKAYNGEVECPSNVLYQSNYPELGYGYYEVIEVDTPYFHSITYFSYG